MPLIVDLARLEDIEKLLRLYYSVYGATYPLPLGSDQAVMRRMIEASETVYWLVTRDCDTGAVVGSAVFETDPYNKIVKLEGVVVDPKMRNRSVANLMIVEGTKRFLGPEAPFNSLYATTRTVSVGPQLMCLKNGFLPLGIFPNAHKLTQYESVTLLARFRDGILARREPVFEIPAKIAPLLAITEATLKAPPRDYKIIQPRVPTTEERSERRTPQEFEFLYAPSYVERRYLETFPDRMERFYPFHTPNLMIASKDGKVEIYAFLSKSDRYCTICACTVPITTLEGRLGGLFDQLADYGASYVETLVPLGHRTTLEALLEFQFVGSAIYPAMREREGKVEDIVVMSRTMEPLNFRGMAIDKSFKPYIDQYVDSWKQMYLDVLEVFNDPK